MAVDLKELAIVRHGEKFLFGASIVLCVVVVAFKAMPDPKVDELQGGAKTHRQAMDDSWSRAESSAGEESLEAPALKELTQRQWKPIAPFALGTRWAFYLTPHIRFHEVQPPDKHVVGVPSNLTAQATQSEVQLSWNAPPSEFEDPSESDPERRVKTVAEVTKYAIYRWTESEAENGQGGRNAGSLYMVVDSLSIEPDGASVSYTDQGSSEEALEPNETYHYQVAVLTSIMEAKGGQPFSSDAALQVATEASNEIAVRIPDNVEIRLLGLNFLNNAPMARVKVRKSVGGTWFAHEFSVKEGARIGVETSDDGQPRWVYPTIEGGSRSQQRIDMSTKYLLHEFKKEMTQKVLPVTEKKYRFVSEGTPMEEWAKDQDELREKFPGVDQFDRILTPQGGSETRTVPRPQFGPDGTPWMEEIWSIVVENTEARPGQKKLIEYAVEED